MSINFSDEVDKAFNGDEAALELVRKEVLALHENVEAEMHDKLTAVRTDWKDFEDADSLYGNVAECLLGQLVYREDIIESTDVIDLRNMHITLEATRENLTVTSDTAFFKWAGSAYKDVIAGMDAADFESDVSFEEYDDGVDYTDPNGMG